MKINWQWESEAAVWLMLAQFCERKSKKGCSTDDYSKIKYQNKKLLAHRPSSFTKLPVLIRKTTMQVDCQSSLLRPTFTFVVRWWPLVAIVTIIAVKEGVRLSSLQSEKVHIGRRLDMGGWVKQARLLTRKLCVYCQTKSKQRDISIYKLIDIPSCTYVTEVM